jgi:RNA polymerase sigma-70 factor, ECF subfamily
VPAAHRTALSGEPDEALLGRSAGGDTAAFDEVVRRHQAAVFRFLTTLGVTGADAEDLLQESFVAAWRGAATYAAAGSVRSWLLSIARNAVRHHRRRRVGEPAALASLEELALRAGWGEPAASPPAGDADRAEDARALIERALARLGAEEREVLLLRDIEGLSGEETARALALGVPAMKSRLHRARLHLAAVIREDGDAGA